MKPTLLLSGMSLSLICLLPLSSQAQQQELARVISSTPVMQQVPVPQQVCSNSQVMVQPQKSGAGAVLGAIAGGAIGSQVGGGSGKALAIGAGVISGAILGDRAESAPLPYAQPVTSCTTQTRYENRITAYNVVYEYAGRQYSLQTASPPGEWLPVQVSPAVTQAASAPVAVAPAPVAMAPVVVAPPVITSYPSIVYPAPVYYGPSYGPSYGSGVSLRYSYGSGWGGGYGHGHWR